MTSPVEMGCLLPPRLRVGLGRVSQWLAELLGSAPSPAVAFTLCGGARNGRLTSVRSGQGVEALLRTIPKQGLHESFSIWQPFRPGKKGVVALVFPAETGLGLAQILAADRDSRETDELAASAVLLEVGNIVFNLLLSPLAQEDGQPIAYGLPEYQTDHAPLSASSPWLGALPPETRFHVADVVFGIEGREFPAHLAIAGPADLCEQPQDEDEERRFARVIARGRETEGLGAAASGAERHSVGEALDLLPLGACVVDAEGTVVAWNPLLERWTGLPRDRVVGTRLTQWFPEAGRPDRTLRVRLAAGLGLSWQFTSALHKAFLGEAGRVGTLLPLIQETEIRPWRAGSGLAAVTIRDVTIQHAQLAALRFEQSESLRTRRLLQESNDALEHNVEVLVQTNNDLYREISERLVAEQRLRESEQAAHRLARIASRTSNLVVLTDTQGRIEWVNDAFTRVTQFGFDDVVGRRPGGLLQGPGTDPQTVERIREGALRRERVEFELLQYSRGGREFWVEGEILPLLDAAGAHVGYMAIGSEITSRKAAELELIRAKADAEAAARAKSEFLANMSHEIRTPMTAILGYAEAIAEGSLGPAETQSAMRTIRRCGEHLLTVINDILDISRIESGQLTVEQIECCPATLLREVRELFAARMAERGLSFEFEQRTRLPHRIRTDPTRLRQILVNLLSNALKFTLQGGIRVVSRMVRRGLRVMLSVSVIDTGIGIATEQLPRLFKTFSQADASTTRRFGGTGLGLAISKRLAEMLGGSIGVSSTPEVGSEFTATVDAGPAEAFREELPELFESSENAALPTESLDVDASFPIGCPAPAVQGAGPAARREEPPRPAPVDAVEGSTHEPPPPAADLVRGEILLAEDCIDNQRLISLILRRHGWMVTLAENGRKAVDLVARRCREGRPFDLVLMDMLMPEMDGYRATRLLRELGVTTPIVALTANAMAGDREKCLAAGCDDYATKPIRREDLLGIVQRNLRNLRSEAVYDERSECSRFDVALVRN